VALLAGVAALRAGESARARAAAAGVPLAGLRAAAAAEAGGVGLPEANGSEGTEADGSKGPEWAWAGSGRAATPEAAPEASEGGALRAGCTAEAVRFRAAVGAAAGAALRAELRESCGGGEDQRVYSRDTGRGSSREGGWEDVAACGEEEARFLFGVWGEGEERGEARNLSGEREARNLSGEREARNLRGEACERACLLAWASNELLQPQ
jgi:hypothetical protein